MVISILKQPLLHFLLLGTLIFLAYSATENVVDGEATSSDDTIVVDRSALLNFMQYQAGAFEPDLFEARLDALNGEELDALVLDYVREEALYREALKLSMDVGDYIIRQRLVQKVEFLLENLAITGINPTTEELQAFYQARRADYQVAPSYTFTHIFFDTRLEGPERALTRANQTLAGGTLASAGEASQFGDRFPFLQVYTERSRDFIVNNFSAEFVNALDELVPDPDAWQGPLASRYGFHLVLLQARSAEQIPEFDDIRERVLDDFRYEALLRARQEAEQRVMAEYSVELEL